MRERGGRIEDAAKVFDEMLAAGKVKPSLRSGSGSRMCAARTCADVTRQGRSERMSSSRKRRSSCTACRTTVCREVTRGAGGATVRRLRADPYGAAGSRVMNIGGRRGESSGRHGPNTGRPWSSRRQRWECGVASRKEKLRNEGDGWA
jgi:pentatricopeptide repeat protein